MVSIILLYMMVLTIESMNKILKYCHSNENSSTKAAFSFSAIYFAVQDIACFHIFLELGNSIA